MLYPRCSHCAAALITCAAVEPTESATSKDFFLNSSREVVESLDIRLNSTNAESSSLTLLTALFKAPIA